MAAQLNIKSHVSYSGESMIYFKHSQTLYVGFSLTSSLIYNNESNSKGGIIAASFYFIS
ncbi:hypothetical protein Hanom_Chr03g00274481 [Helianthus anomalus]